jgi:hypothetical protein
MRIVAALCFGPCPPFSAQGPRQMARLAGLHVHANTVPAQGEARPSPLIRCAVPPV